MPHRPSFLASSTASTAALIAIVTAIPILMAAGMALASEKAASEQAPSAANARALPETYRVSLTFEEGKETMVFSTVTAMRHFSLAPPERRLRFRGRLWLQADGRELLDFSVELGQQIAQKDRAASVATDGSWSGSAYVDSGRPIEIAKSPNSTITVSLTRQ